MSLARAPAQRHPGQGRHCPPPPSFLTRSFPARRETGRTSKARGSGGETPPCRPPKAASVRVLGAGQGPRSRLPCPGRAPLPACLWGEGRAEPESAKSPTSHLTHTCVHPNTHTHAASPADTDLSQSICVFGGGLGRLAPGTQVHGTVSGCENDRAARTPWAPRVGPSSPLHSRSISI